MTKISNETPNASTADPIEQAESALQTHPVAADLDSAAVAAWLMAHPDFFQDHPEALTAVELQHASGAAVSLIERQVQALRMRNQELEKQLRDLVGFARENDKLSEGMHRLSLSLMDAEDREEIEHLVYESLRGYFQVEFVAVRIARKWSSWRLSAVSSVNPCRIAGSPIHSRCNGCSTSKPLLCSRLP